MKWTFEKLQEEANKCKDRKEFRKNNNAFIAAYSKNLLDELFKNHPNNGYNKKPDGYWSKETLQKEANKYETRWQFGKEDNAAYSRALKKGLMNELFKNHPNQGYDENHKKSGYWTKEELQNIVNKYKTRGEFQKKNRKAYSAAFDKNLLNELFKNHKNNGYSDIDKYRENIYVIYVYELKEYNKAYVGLTNNMKRRDLDHLFGSKKDNLYKFCKNNNITFPDYKILEDNLISTEAQKQEQYWIDFYKNNNWEMFNSNKAGSLGTLAKKWSKKALQEEVNKYKTRGEFQKNSTAYNSAFSKNLINELFKNHPNQGYINTRHKRNYWNIEKLQIESNKYKNRKEFRENSNDAYCYALRLKVVNELFKNHPNQGYILNIKNQND